MTEATARAKVPLAWLPAFLWLVILLRVAEMLPPDLSPVDFTDLQKGAFAVSTATSDIANQLFWLTIAGLVTLVILLQGPERLLRLLPPLSILPVFLAFCLISALWATHPDISFRRTLLLIIGVYCAAGATAYCRSEDEILRVAYLAFAITLVANLASMAFPFSFDYRGLFRGLSGDKNFLGVIAVTGLFIGAMWRTRLSGSFARAMNAAYLAAWVGLLILSGNKTAAALVFAAPAAAWLILLATRETRLKMPVILALGGALVACLLLIVTVVLDMTVAEALGTILPDASFTGRDEIWAFSVDQWQTRWLLGFGYGSFWGVGFDAPNLQASPSFIHLLTQSHNGYLDLALTVGAAGLTLMLAFLWQVLLAIDRLRVSDRAFFLFAVSLLIFLLVHNVTESSLARGLAMPWIITVALCFMTARRLASRVPEEPSGG
ncbi:hypothetical protein T281_06705 [Rhodomicrobium udaipurense JA643]|uniref:O-antigen ligase family protein n=1 Tax=Rhodomicrobium udaipurense TaxID=1202716 RepID=A0A8I1GFE5_9HYPH|nr:O-antigen ligase family protein [Rhodomicrobium udaipurense]KAI95228.1 hypothetical protein T281_06705 [Rhodomicrobium udaipurense JA643]MBJ7542270.1 O-antigen ligase family protein [Rhodomicrobium udaipurense]